MKKQQLIQTDYLSPKHYKQKNFKNRSTLSAIANAIVAVTLAKLSKCFYYDNVL